MLKAWIKSPFTLFTNTRNEWWWEAVVNEEGGVFSHESEVAQLLCPGEISRRNWMSVPGCCENSPFPSLSSPPLGPGRPPGSSLCCPWNYLQEMLLAPFRPLSEVGVGGGEEVFKVWGFAFVVFGVTVPSFGRYRDELESAPHLYWILRMVFPLGKEEWRRGDRILGGMLALTSSAGLCSRLTTTHEKL